MIVSNRHGNLRTMVYRLELQQKYPVSPERIREVFTNPDYLREKLRTVGGPGAKLVQCEHDGKDVIIVLEYAIPSEALPSYLRSAWPDGVTICRIESWTDSNASVRASIEGMPGTITVTLRLKSEPVGCVLGVLAAAEAPLPTFGDTIEKMIVKKVAQQMAAEHQFTLDWLSSSASL